MSNFWYYTLLALCLLLGLKSLVAGIKGESKIMWLSINSVNQNQYEKNARIYNLILGAILTFSCGYVLISNLFD